MNSGNYGRYRQQPTYVFFLWEQSQSASPLAVKIAVTTGDVTGGRGREIGLCLGLLEERTTWSARGTVLRLEIAGG